MNIMIIIMTIVVSVKKSISIFYNNILLQFCYLKLNETIMH